MWWDVHIGMTATIVWPDDQNLVLNAASHIGLPNDWLSLLLNLLFYYKYLSLIKLSLFFLKTMPMLVAFIFKLYR